MTKMRLALILTVIAMVAAAAYLLPRLSGNGAFLVPSQAQADRNRVGFAAFLAGERDGQHLPEGLAIAPGATAVVALREGDGDCRGRGNYVLHEMTGDGAGKGAVALVAPHRGADLHTGPIAASMFAEHAFAALATNSAPRRASAECPGGGDIAREPTHHLSAFSLAFAEQYPGGRIVQLHGFDRARRAEDDAAHGAGAILSNGTDQPDDAVIDAAACLTATTGVDALVYPLETRELGALTNAQGAVLREAGFTGFLHLELSLPLRQRLKDDPALRAALAQCLGVAAR